MTCLAFVRAWNFTARRTSQEAMLPASMRSGPPLGWSRPLGHGSYRHVPLRSEGYVRRVGNGSATARDAWSAARRGHLVASPRPPTLLPPCPTTPSPFDLPDQGDQPVVWDAHRREFVPLADPGARRGCRRARSREQWFVGSDAVGKAPPPASGTVGGGPPGDRRRSARPRTRAPDAAQPQPAATARRPGGAPAAPRRRPSPGPKAPRRRRRFLRLPKLRWILAFVLLLPLLLAAFGWWYASSKFNAIERVPVSSVLSPTVARAPTT